jgi:hypothetical protein
MATQVVSRIREIFQIDLPVRTLFESPTIRTWSKHIEEAFRNRSGVLSPPIEPVARDKDMPVSFVQHRLWFLWQLDPDGSAYNIQQAVRIEGLLDLSLLRRALNEIVKRHEMLRTCFSSRDGQPRQQINGAHEVATPLIDLTSLCEQARDSEAMRAVNQIALVPFNLATGPLFRVCMIRLDYQHHIIVLSLHHIVSDGWSVGILAREIAELYSAFSEGRQPRLAENPIQYADYAAWQRDWMQGEVLEKHLQYWSGRLSGSMPNLQLPADQARAAVQTYRGAVKNFLLPAELSRHLSALSRQNGASLFMVLLAAFKVLLHRYSGEEDIVVGSNITTRNRTELEGVIGCFVNNLVLRTDLSGNPSFREIIRRVREVCLGAYAYQDTPFERIVEEIQPERSTSHHPLFQVAFVVQNNPHSSLKLPGLTLTPVKVAYEEATFDLVFVMSETDDGLLASVRYNADLFNLATIDRMWGHFETLLADIVSDPDKSISSFSLVSAEEIARMSDSFNASLEAD